jgi:hypothetical protein
VVVDGGRHAVVPLAVIGPDELIDVSYYRCSVVVESIGEEEEVAFVGDLGKDHAGAVDVLGVFEVWAAPRVCNVHIAGEVLRCFDVQDKVKFLHDCFLVVVSTCWTGLNLRPERIRIEICSWLLLWRLASQLDCVWASEWVNSGNRACFTDGSLDKPETITFCRQRPRFYSIFD